MDDFVRKPYRPEEIFACMERHLNVRYREIAPVGSLHRDEAVPLPEALGALSADLRQELADAVVSLDRGRILIAIERVREVDPALADVLRGLADRLALTTIAHALEASAAVPLEPSTAQVRSASER